MFFFVYNICDFITNFISMQTKKSWVINLKDSEWGFLASTRFWSLVLIAAAQWLLKDEFISPAQAEFITVVAGGFITLRTIDKFKRND